MLCISYFVTLCGRIKEAACKLRNQNPTFPGCALSRCEKCFKQVWSSFNWVWTVQHCLYMDSPRYMKHSCMTWNLYTKQRTKKKAACILLIPICKFLVVLYSGLLNTLVSTTATLQIHLNYMQHYQHPTWVLTRLYMHVGCIKKWFRLIWSKILSFLFLLPFFDLGWQNLPLLKNEWSGCEYRLSHSS